MNKSISCNIIVVIFLSTIVSAIGCKKDGGRNFYEDVAGVWAPYQIKYEDGNIQQDSLVGNTIFGTYKESVDLKSDRSFVPGSFYPGHFQAGLDEAGSFEYIPEQKKISFDAPQHDFDFYVIKLNDNELWLSSTAAAEVVYYYRKR